MAGLQIVLSRWKGDAKSVIQAIPAYAMSCFRIPSSLCKEIEQLCAKFWWNSSNDRSKIYWTKWRSLCKPKQLGGLGFQSMIEFNKALIAKQVWRIIHCPDSLMARILKARYFRNVDILDATSGSNHLIFGNLLFGAEISLSRESGGKLVMVEA